MLNAKNFGLAGGILWGVSMFVMTWLSLWFGYGNMWMELMASVYPGYTVSVVGSFVGLVYGFFDGFIGLFIFAWLYNLLNK